MKIQLAYFEKLKSLHPNKKKIPKELQDILGISADSAYRRLRGETALSIDEAFKLSHHYNMSVSDLESIRNNHVIFNKQPFIKTLDHFEQFMRLSLEHLHVLLEDPNHLLVYTAKDIPIFYPYKFKKLAAFKIYVWMRNFFDISHINEQHITMDNLPSSILELAEKQWQAYNKVNAIEIWNDTTILSMVKQIEYFYEAGLLNSKEEALTLCDEFSLLIKHIYKQAMHGKRMFLEDDERPSNVDFKMYFNEVLIMDNNIISRVNNRLMYSVPYGAVNFVNTTNQELAGDMYDYMMRQAHKSSLISDVSEKDRNRFFIRLRNRVDELRQRIENHNPFVM